MLGGHQHVRPVNAAIQTGYGPLSCRAEYDLTIGAAFISAL